MAKTNREFKEPLEDDDAVHPAFWALEGYDDPDAFMAKISAVGEQPLVVGNRTPAAPGVSSFGAAGDNDALPEALIGDEEAVAPTASYRYESPRYAFTTDSRDAVNADETSYSWSEAQPAFMALTMEDNAAGQSEEAKDRLARLQSVRVGYADSEESAHSSLAERAPVTLVESYSASPLSPFFDDAEEARHDEAGVGRHDALVPTYDEDQRQHKPYGEGAMDDDESLDVSAMQHGGQAENADDWEEQERSEQARQRGRWLLGVAAGQNLRKEPEASTPHASAYSSDELAPHGEGHDAPAPLTVDGETALGAASTMDGESVRAASSATTNLEGAIPLTPIVENESNALTEHATGIEGAPIPLSTKTRKVFTPTTSWMNTAGPKAKAARPAAEASATTAGASNMLGRDVPRRTQRLVIGAIPVVIVVGALGWSTLQKTPTVGTNTAPPPPAFAPRAPFTPIAGSSLAIASVLGSTTGLYAPREAASLGDGRIAVVDTGHARTVILDARGRLLTTLRPARGAVKPVALSVGAAYIYVLDATSGSIDRYLKSGVSFRTVITNAALKGATGLALGPGKTLYVANPLTNQITAIDGSNGQILRQLSPSRGAGQGIFAGPTDVAASTLGSLYVLDSGADRIEELTPRGAYVAQWATPHSTAKKPVHLLALPDRRVAATDPSGALLVYPRGSGPATRHTLTGAGVVQPLGLSLNASNDQIIVVDAKGDRLLQVHLPR